VSFVAELKQRKVFRVATVYLIVAWIAVQAASIALPAFDAPAWVLRVVILLIALGFPFALVLAWALDITPDGVHFSSGGAGSKRIALIASALALLALVWFFRGQPALRPGDVAKAENPSVEPATARSIAVLPFVNMSGDPANEYFSDGIAETTLDMLAQVPNLKVVARTSSFAFKGQSTDVRKIGAALGAATLLEGSVQRAGDTVRITAQLVRATDGFHLWSSHFDRQLSDVFKIQDEVATEVVRALEVSLPADDQQRLTQKRTENVDAYQEYLKGIALLPGRKVVEMREAAQHFERAISLDPAYARAYVAASDTYELLQEYATISDEERRRAVAYADRALALAPELGEAHASRASWLHDQHDEAEREFRRAIELSPSYASAYQWYGELRTYQMHDFAAGERLFRRATELDPLSAIMQDQVVYPLMSLSRFDEARAELDKLHRAHPEFAQGYFTQGRLGVARVDLVAALRGYREHAARDPAAIGHFREACWTLMRFGAVAEALHCVDDLIPRFPAEQGLHADRIEMEFFGGNAGARSQLERIRNEKVDDSGFEAYLLVVLDRAAEARELMEKQNGRLFADPPPTLYAGELREALLAGLVQLHSGAQTQGQALVRQVLETDRNHPGNRAANDTTWDDVTALVLLGDVQQALATMEQRVAAGPVLDIVGIDGDPIFAPLRADPRYEKAMAPARKYLAEQVAAAKAAGLL
jgi:TolB-like protein/tetratricopeptide (TPR) repeat protein